MHRSHPHTHTHTHSHAHSHAHGHAHSHFHLSKNRYSAKNMAKPVNFVCRAPDAKAVFITGDFNDWHPTSHPMHRQPDGAWQIHLPLNHGHHHYRFIVDGKPELDPRASGVARDLEGNKASLISVS